MQFAGILCFELKSIFRPILDFKKIKDFNFNRNYVGLLRILMAFRLLVMRYQHKVALQQKIYYLRRNMEKHQFQYENGKYHPNLSLHPDI